MAAAFALAPIVASWTVVKQPGQDDASSSASKYSLARVESTTIKSPGLDIFSEDQFGSASHILRSNPSKRRETWDWTIFCSLYLYHYHVHELLNPIQTHADKVNCVANLNQSWSKYDDTQCIIIFHN